MSRTVAWTIARSGRTPEEPEAVRELEEAVRELEEAERALRTRGGRREAVLHESRLRSALRSAEREEAREAERGRAKSARRRAEEKRRREEEEEERRLREEARTLAQLFSPEAEEEEEQRKPWRRTGGPAREEAVLNLEEPPEVSLRRTLEADVARERRLHEEVVALELVLADELGRLLEPIGVPTTGLRRRDVGRLSARELPAALSDVRDSIRRLEAARRDYIRQGGWLSVPEERAARPRRHPAPSERGGFPPGAEAVEEPESRESRLGALARRARLRQRRARLPSAGEAEIRLAELPAWSGALERARRAIAASERERRRAAEEEALDERLGVVAEGEAEERPKRTRSPKRRRR